LVRGLYAQVHGGGFGATIQFSPCQREAAEAYIKSQRHEGWRVLAEKYENGVINDN
jgi:hypothetical protein